MNLSLIYEADQGKTSVNFTQVEHYILLIIFMSQSNDARTLLVELWSILFIISIDARDIYQNINQLWAYFVVFHVDWGGIRGDIDLRDNIEEEGFLDFGPGT